MAAKGLVSLCLAFSSLILLTQATRMGLEAQPCKSADWQPYGDEKCFTVVPLNKINASSLTYDQATALCKSLHPEATLPSIGSDEEQAHIEDLAMPHGSIWIGAKLNLGKLLWQDEAHYSNFTNWSEYLRIPKRGNFCVLMDDGSHGRGNWTFHSCGKSFMLPVLCQKHQVWGLTKMRQILIKHTDTVDKKLQHHRRKLVDEEAKLSEYEEEILFLRDKVQNQTNVSLDLSQQVGSLNTSTNVWIPVGFIYIQYRDQAAPQTIWPNFTWTEATSSYAGEFFRAVGGNSAAFGSSQSENFPKITGVQYENLSTHPTNISIGYGDTSPAVMTGTYSSGYNNAGISFTASLAETRPYNSAVKIWKRTS